MADETYSYINMILLSVLGGFFVMMSALLGYWASDVNQRLRTLTDLDQEATEKLSELETWAKGHDKQDDERHDENRDRLERLTADMCEVRRHLRVPNSRPYPPERNVMP